MKTSDRDTALKNSTGVANLLLTSVTVTTLLKERKSHRLLPKAIFPNENPASLLCILSVQQPSVLSDLHLQPGLDVEQHLVILGLPVNVGPHSRQLLLQAVDHGLELVQLPVVAALSVIELALQSRFLQEEEEEEASTARFPPLTAGLWMLNSPG